MIKKIDKGYSFGSGHRIIGYLFLFIGLFIMTNVIIYLVSSFSFSWFPILLGVIFLISGLTLSFGREYLLIDYKKDDLSNVLNIVGVKFTKKNSLSIYKNISIISKRYTYDNSYNDIADVVPLPSFNDYQYKHDLVFLTQKHLGRLLISQFEDYNEALELGETVAKLTGRPLVKYAPKRIAKKTRR